MLLIPPENQCPITLLIRVKTPLLKHNRLLKNNHARLRTLRHVCDVMSHLLAPRLLGRYR